MGAALAARVRMRSHQGGRAGDSRATWPCGLPPTPARGIAEMAAAMAARRGSLRRRSASTAAAVRDGATAASGSWRRVDLGDVDWGGDRDVTAPGSRVRTLVVAARRT